MILAWRTVTITAVAVFDGTAQAISPGRIRVLCIERPGNREGYLAPFRPPALYSCRLN